MEADYHRVNNLATFYHFTLLCLRILHQNIKDISYPLRIPQNNKVSQRLNQLILLWRFFVQKNDMYLLFLMTLE